MKRMQIGSVPYLNACVLADGLSDNRSVEIKTVRPSLLARMLEDGSLDVALVPAVDYLARKDRWKIAANYCIASCGPVWTVKIFSPVDLSRIDELIVDVDSHSSVNLARVLFDKLTGRVPKFVAKSFPSNKPITISQPSLLIGDKAWQVKKLEFTYDLGELWTKLTSLPFVFALWASDGDVSRELKDILTSTAQRNLDRIDELSEVYGPKHGFNIDDAREYLSGIIHYRLGEQELKGMKLFDELLNKLRNTTCESNDQRTSTSTPCP